ncbi:hypothetical protein QJS04_geneDACA006737 [Acorus gramineus]|uniref:Uncharacterized protein n=1 Tax=Acorus gramineus TaxID=55184 RepID=A0AAV9AUW8_ACOGR|nr:hypothetical protein QJS04_geneDACA006737 [Acorus gramineus]
MLRKLITGRSTRCGKSTAVKAPPPPPPPPLSSSSTVRIIHAGGLIEYYYMAVPAAKVLEKYPSSCLARPNVFRSPCESIVRPDEILTPGHKYYVVPRRTVRKLQARARWASGPAHRPDGLVSEDSESDSSGRSVEGRRPALRAANGGRKKKAVSVAWHPMLKVIDEVSPVIGPAKANRFHG